MSNPNVIAVLTTADAFTQDAFLHPHNQARYVPPSRTQSPMCSRESTPFFLDGVEEHHGAGEGRKTAEEDYSGSHQLMLTFDKPPKDPKRGFVFGYGPDCDIQLVDRSSVNSGQSSRVRAVSEKHFSITFDQQRRLIVRDTSRNGTCVSYNRQTEYGGARSYFSWILFEWCTTVQVVLPKARIEFDIHVVSHAACQGRFRANIDTTFPLNDTAPCWSRPFGGNQARYRLKHII